MKSLLKISVAATALMLFGCSAMNTALKKQELDIESRLSYSVVLEPLAPAERVVYARVRDVSGNQMRKDMQKVITSQLKSEGFTVTNDPKKANLMLNATIISAGKTTEEEANALLSSGYKGGIEGAATGATISGLTGGSSSDMAKAGLAMAAAGFLADALVEDVYYTFVMDVQLRERPLDGDSIYNATTNLSAKGLGTKNAANLSLSESSVERGDNFQWIVHETRIVTTANQMNLKIEEALPEVKTKTAISLTEMLM